MGGGEVPAPTLDQPLQSAIIFGSLFPALRPLCLVYNIPIPILPQSYLYIYIYIHIYIYIYNIIIYHIIICQVSLLVYNHRTSRYIATKRSSQTSKNNMML